MRSIEIEFPSRGRFTREWLDEHPDDAQALLAACKGGYPQCLCRGTGLPLYIAQRTRYYLARMPDTGPQHAPYCPSYEPDRAFCGWGIYSSNALADHGDGRLSIKLGVPLLIRGGSGGNAVITTPAVDGERPYRDSIELRGLLHLLWERAGFNRWVPRMRNRRHYRQIYKYLIEAAETITVRRQLLTRHLFMPEPFVPAQALEIHARRQRAFRELSQTSSRMPLRILVCGQIRSIVESEAESGLRLSHLPNEFVIRASPQLLMKLRQASEFAWIDWPALNSEFRLIVLLTMQRTANGHWRADEIASIATNENYIPVLAMEEALLAKRLIAEDRYFYKPLPYDAPHMRFPNFLLTDCHEHAVALEIATGNDADSATRHLRIAQYVEDHQAHWLWNAKESALSPALPQPSI